MIKNMYLMFMNFKLIMVNPICVMNERILLQ